MTARSDALAAAAGSKTPRRRARGVRTHPEHQRRPRSRADVRASAELTADLLRAHGLESVRLADVDGSHPVRDRRMDARAPRAHPLSFSMRITMCSPRDRRQLGERPVRTRRTRGSALRPRQRGRQGRAGSRDAHAVSAWLDTSGASPATCACSIEGEEEIGSPTLQSFLEAHVDELRSDVLVLADAGNWKVGVPASPITSGPRRGRHRGSVPSTGRCTPEWRAAPSPTR